MIDNKEYEFFVVRKGRIRPKHGKRGMGKTVLLLAGTAALLGSVLFFLLPASKRDSLKGPILKPLGIVSRTETQVVLLRSGQIYYAEKVERDGTVIKITEKNGSVVTADEKDVLQIAKAVLED